MKLGKRICLSKSCDFVWFRSNLFSFVARNQQNKTKWTKPYRTQKRRESRSSFKNGCAGATLHSLYLHIELKTFFLAGLVVIPCSLKSCTNNAFCTFSSGSVACRCPDINDCSTVRNPVCGSDGTNQKIYDNLCSMEVESCKLGKTISPVPDEKCG